MAGESLGLAVEEASGGSSSHSSNHSQLTESFKPEHQFLRVPFEHLKKTIRFNRRLVEREVSALLFGIVDSSDCHLSPDDAVNNFSFLVSKIQSLKRTDAPPLHLPELLASFVKQTEPFLGHLGVKRDVCDKIVGSLYRKTRNMLQWQIFSDCRSFLQQQYMDNEIDIRIASVLKNTGHSLDGRFWHDTEKCVSIDKRRHVSIITTASLPWMTGTAINPLFRAAYLSKSSNQNVLLLVPWLSQSDQKLVYPENHVFDAPKQQETYIHNWLEERLGFKADFKISFYPGKFSKERRSIIPAGDTSQFIPERDADIAILEEPEHLNWYHHGRRWTDKFNHVVGVVHTNYLEYIKREKNGVMQAFLVKHINNLVTRIHCHKVLRLSHATQDFPRSVICNVHGVNPRFLSIGEKMASEVERGERAFSKGAYFLGKMVWAKGYGELIQLLANKRNELKYLRVDVFGNGEDANEIESAAVRVGVKMNFMKGRDHGHQSLLRYKLFINPCVSDVLCTATAEALAMGKFVVCVDHPSNEFFRAFPNCLMYTSAEEFVERVEEAMAGDPKPLTREERECLSWEAATQRFLHHSEVGKMLKERGSRMRSGVGAEVWMVKVVERGLALAHYCLSGSEMFRLWTGCVPGTRNYDTQLSRELHLLPPQVADPVYAWW